MHVMRWFKAAATRLLRDESGGPLVEYALVLALFSMFAALGFQAIAVSANGQYSRSTTGMSNVQENPLPTYQP